MLTLTPINLKTANAFVQQYHRHHKPTRGHKFSIGVSKNGALVGVAICGRPVARRLDDIRNPVTKRNEIDPETAFYVQLIFQWVLMGVAIFEIARRLTLLKVPTPREWHRKIVEGKEVVTYKNGAKPRYGICWQIKPMWEIPSTIKVHRDFLLGRTNVTCRKSSGMWQKIHIQPSLQGMTLKRCRRF